MPEQIAAATTTRRPAARFRQIVPNFFIVGASKSGTTSLFEALARHHDVFCCPVKEPNYFAFDLTSLADAVGRARREGALIEGRPLCLIEPSRVGMTLDHSVYLELFDTWDGQKAIGEASTSYLTSAVAAQEISRLVPDARIVIILRDPVARTYSEYLMQVQIGHAVGTFREAVARDLERMATDRSGASNAVASSLYAPQLRRYLQQFPREQILVLLFEELVAEPRRTLQVVFRHLGVDPYPASDIPLGWENKSRLPRFQKFNQMLLGTGLKSTLLRAVPRPIRHRLRPLYYTQQGPEPLSPDDRAMLLELFRADIEETAGLIGRDLSHWL